MTEATPGFNNNIPASILTPDSVETRIGRLEFFDGFPTEATTRAVYDHLDFLRAVQVFLDFVPATSMEAMRRGSASMGVTAPNQVVIFDNLMDSNSLFLTGNTDTVYSLRLSRRRRRRADRRRGATAVRARHGQRRVLPVRHRHGWARTRPRARRQVSDRAGPTTTGTSPTATSSVALRARRTG